MNGEIEYLTRLFVLAFPAGVVHPEGRYHFFYRLLLRLSLRDKSGEPVACNDPLPIFVLGYVEFFHRAETSHIIFFYLKYIKSGMEF